jgi:hypothetical protein
VAKSRTTTGKPAKAKAEKKYTRAQAEKALANGVDASLFEKHANYHVRAKAWKKLGSPLPDGAEEQEKFLKSIHQWKAPPAVETPAEPIG